MTSIESKQIVDLDAAYHILTEFTDRFGSEACYQDETWRKEYVEKVLGHGYFIATYHKDECICFLTGYVNDDTKESFVSCMATRDKLGILQGKAMITTLKYSIRIALDRGSEAVSLEVNKDNTLAYNLYKKLGLTEVPSDKENVIRMHTDLDSISRFLKV